MMIIFQTDGVANKVVKASRINMPGNDFLSSMLLTTRVSKGKWYFIFVGILEANTIIAY